MGRLFDMDNKFFTFMGRVADLFILNVLFVICCIPIITIGASFTALFYVAMKMVRNEESYIIRDFFKSFKQNFKQATIINLIMLVVLFVLGLDLNIVKNMGGSLSRPLTVVFLAFAILYVFVFLYIYPVLAKFYNTTKNTFINAFLMSIRHLPFTIIMLIITALPIAALFIPNARLQSGILTILMLIGPASIAYSNAGFFVKIFDNYIPKENSEESTENADMTESGKEE